MGQQKIAIFPIPEQVSFPETQVPLHVFEPRYRSMIKDCVKSNTKIGVCHIDDIINEGPRNQPSEKALNSNQATFKPKSIFSAGYCTIDDVTPDGRFKVHIDMDSRYQLIEMTQEVPYIVGLCEEYLDIESIENHDYISTMRIGIDNFLIEFASNSKNQNFVDFLRSKEWKNISNETYSFKIFEKIKLEGDLAQIALEKRFPHERLKIIYEILRLSERLS